MASSATVGFRPALLSSGELTTEVQISDGRIEVYECSPVGLTVGLKERPRVLDVPHDAGRESFEFNTDLSQRDFDAAISSNYGSEISTAMSLAYLRFRAARAGWHQADLHKFIAEQLERTAASPGIVCNVLNGGIHGESELAFCEFMILPKAKDAREHVEIASEVYLDLKDVIADKLGARDTLVGREGGFAPSIRRIEHAMDLLVAAIERRHAGQVGIGLDIAANSFSCVAGEEFVYQIEGKTLTTAELVDYYGHLLETYSEIEYLEDGLHEDDIEGWQLLYECYHDKALVVADDLTVSTVNLMQKNQQCFNACVLKVNQAGDVSSLFDAARFCFNNGIRSIVSQRSGETDSSILTHMAVGLGCDLLKAGAPARERIVKYNELIRLEDRERI